METRKAVLISGYYGMNNVGDDLLLATIIGKLRSFNKNIDISITVKSKLNLPEDIALTVNCIEPPTPGKVKLFRIFNTIFHEIQLFRKHDVYMYGGGTRLFETENRSYQSLLIKFIILKVNKLLFNRKVIHLGVGVGNIYSKKGKWLLKQIVCLSDLILLRDENSYRIVKSIARKSETVFLGSDLIFLNGGSYPAHEHETQGGPTKIGLSFFQYYGYISNDITKKEIFKSQIINLIQYLNDSFSNAEIYLFSFQKGAGGRDEEFNNEICSAFSGRNIAHVKYSTDTTSVIEQLSAMDLCIGMRFHFCLLALFFNIKTIGVNYQPKVKNEFDELGLGDFCFGMEEIENICSVIRGDINSENSEIKYKNAFNIINKRKTSLNNLMNTLLVKFL